MAAIIVNLQSYEISPKYPTLSPRRRNAEAGFFVKEMQFVLHE